MTVDAKVAQADATGAVLGGADGAVSTSVSQVAEARRGSLPAVLSTQQIAVGLGLIGLTIWAYLPTFSRLVRIWWSDPQYSHGFLVPLFSGALCWLRRDRIRWDLVRPSWWGVPVLLAGAALRIAGSYLYMEWFEHISLLPVGFGLLLAVGGWQLLKAWWPAVLFLIFMIPFPYRFEVALSDPLQKIATRASTYLLQTIGEPAVAEGNTILVNDHRLEVVQACNGLRMAVSFVALSVAVVMVVNRPIWERLLILASALPIALISNVIRITVTGVLSNHFDAEIAQVFFHDVAGWLMMPLALGLLWGELALVDWILVEEEEPERIRVRPTGAGPVRAGAGQSATSHVAATAAGAKGVESNGSTPAKGQKGANARQGGGARKKKQGARRRKN